MPSQQSIKRAEILLLELANKQAFYDALNPQNEEDLSRISTSVENIVDVTLPRDGEPYYKLNKTLSDSTQLDIEKLIQEIIGLLQK